MRLLDVQTQDDVPAVERSVGNRQGIEHQTLSGLVWTFLGTGSRALVQLLVLAVLARLLTVRDFGVVNVALVIVGVLTTVAQCAVGPAVVQLSELTPALVRTAFTVSLLLGMVLLGVTWVSAGPLAGFFQLSQLQAVLQTMSLILPLQGALIVAESLVQRRMQFRLLAGIDAAAYALGYGLAGVVLALLGFGFWAFVGAYCAQIVVRAALLLSLQPHPVRPLLARRPCADLLRFGGGMVLAALPNYAASQGDSAVVGRWFGADALGLYGRAIQLMVMPAMFIGEVLDKVLFPGMARYQDDRAQLGLAYARAVAVIGLVALPMSAGLLVLAPQIVAVLLGARWDGVVGPFQIFAAALLFRTSYKISDATVRATGAVYGRAWRQGVFALLVVGGAWAGGRWGLPGVAAGVSVAIAVNFLLMAQLCLTLTDLSWERFIRAHLPGLALALVVGVELEIASTIVRQWTASPHVTLLASAATVLVSLPVLLRSAPRVFLGREGHWMLRMLRPYIPRQGGGGTWLSWIMREPA
jgi:O-antigen/teichoic acid export membrane protein